MLDVVAWLERWTADAHETAKKIKYVVWLEWCKMQDEVASCLMPVDKCQLLDKCLMKCLWEERCQIPAAYANWDLVYSEKNVGTNIEKGGLLLNFSFSSASVWKRNSLDNTLYQKQIQFSFFVKCNLFWVFFDIFLEYFFSKLFTSCQSCSFLLSLLETSYFTRAHCLWLQDLVWEKQTSHALSQSHFCQLSDHQLATMNCQLSAVVIAFWFHRVCQWDVSAVLDGSCRGKHPMETSHQRWDSILLWGVIVSKKHPEHDGIIWRKPELANCLLPGNLREQEVHGSNDCIPWTSYRDVWGPGGTCTYVRGFGWSGPLDMMNAYFEVGSILLLSCMLPCFLVNFLYFTFCVFSGLSSRGELGIFEDASHWAEREAKCCWNELDPPVEVGLWIPLETWHQSDFVILQ